MVSLQYLSGSKDDNHATEIVDMTKEVFQDEFEGGKVPENFVRKITYSSGNSNELIICLQMVLLS